MFQEFRRQVEALCGAHAKYLETPRHGQSDLALPCFAVAKELRKSAEQAAQELARKLSGGMHDFRLIRVVESSGSYVNFYADWQKIGSAAIKEIAAKGENFGRVQGKGRVIVEFAHPNTHKLFHIGHLRNITTGEAVSRILEFTGTKVVRANYQGDVGLHIAKCLYGIQKLGMKRQKTLDAKIRFLGEAYAKGSRLYEEDENARKKIVELNSMIYNKDKKIMNLWKETRKWSLDYFDRIYKRVYTKFNRLYFESEVAGKGLKIARSALKKGVLKMSGGAVIFDGQPFGLDTRVFVNKLGFPTYEAKELALAELEFSEFKIDRCIHVVGPEQSSFFRVTFKVQELLNQRKFRDKQMHLVYGWVNLAEGKMSSRLGNVVEGEWLLEDLKKSVLEHYLNKQKYAEKKKSEIAEAIAIAAAKYYMLKIEPIKDIFFDPKAAVSFEGDTGPYLQYTYARAASIMRKSKKKPSKKIRLEEDEIKIVKKLSLFPFIAKKCAQELKPHYLANYLFELSSLFNEFYHAKQVVGTKREAELLLLVSAVATVLKTGLELLGMKALEEM